MIARADVSDEAVPLIRLSLDALVDAAEVFPAIIKGDLHSCIFHIFTTILGTGACQASVVPQALPIFRRFVHSITADAAATPPEARKQMRSTLARFLVILRNAQKRETAASVPCEKNTILASTILLSSANGTFDPDDRVLMAFVAELAECVQNRMTTKVAAGCARSLLLMPGKGPMQAAVAAHLLPRLLGFLADPIDLEGLDESRVVVAQAVVGFAAGLGSEKSAPAFALVVATLLSRASREGKGTHRETAARLLELAAADQAAFRAVVVRMDAEQRGFLETIIREGRGPQLLVRAETGEGKEPSIALKMDF